jgi:hypothetical protein
MAPALERDIITRYESGQSTRRIAATLDQRLELARRQRNSAMNTP